MKHITIIISAICLLTNFGWSQGTGDPGTQEPAAVQERTQLEGLMEDMPTAVKQQIKEAVKKAEQAKAAIKAAAGPGSKPEDVNAFLTQTRTQAQVKLQGAIDALGKLSGEEKAKLEKAVEQVQDRLQEKKSELDEAVKEMAQVKEGN